MRNYGIHAIVHVGAIRFIIFPRKTFVHEVVALSSFAPRHAFEILHPDHETVLLLIADGEVTLYGDLVRHQYRLSRRISAQGKIGGVTFRVRDDGAIELLRTVMIHHIDGIDFRTALKDVLPRRSVIVRTLP